MLKAHHKRNFCILQKLYKNFNRAKYSGFYFAIATQNCHVKNNCHVKHIQVPSNLLHTNLLCPINTPKFSCKTALKHPERLKRIRDSLKSSFFTIILRKSCVLRIVIYAVLFYFKKFYARAGLLPFVIGFKNFGLLFLAERSTSRSTKCFLYRLR